MQAGNRLHGTSYLNMTLFTPTYSVLSTVYFFFIYSSCPTRPSQFIETMTTIRQSSVHKPIKAKIIIKFIIFFVLNFYSTYISTIVKYSNTKCWYIFYYTVVFKILRHLQSGIVSKFFFNFSKNISNTFTEMYSKHFFVPKMCIGH